MIVAHAAIIAGKYHPLLEEKGLNEIEHGGELGEDDEFVGGGFVAEDAHEVSDFGGGDGGWFGP